MMSSIIGDPPFPPLAPGPSHATPGHVTYAAAGDERVCVSARTRRRAETSRRNEREEKEGQKADTDLVPELVRVVADCECVVFLVVVAVGADVWFLGAVAHTGRDGEDGSFFVLGHGCYWASRRSRGYVRR